MSLPVHLHCRFPFSDSRKLLSCRGAQQSARTRKGQYAFRRMERRDNTRCQSTVDDQILDEAKNHFEEGERYKALKLYEKALKQDLSPSDRKKALFGATVVHASFGDIEQAQMTLRESVDQGLDFEAALQDSDLPKWKSGPQVLSQLKKFAKTVKSIKEAVKPASTKTQLNSSIDGAPAKKLNANMDLSEMLNTDISGLDATVTGIVRRLALLVAVGFVIGAILFYVGLELTGIGK